MSSLRRKRGQALVEFCLAFPILLIVILAIIDFSYASFVKVSLESAAASSARLAASSPEVSISRLRRHLRQAAPGIRIDEDGVSLERKSVPELNGRSLAVVRLRSTYRPVVAMLVPADLGNLRLEGTASALCEPVAKGGSR